jgi:hypothetical protein
LQNSVVEELGGQSLVFLIVFYGESNENLVKSPVILESQL